MSLAIREGQTAHLTAAADDPTGAIDPNAIDTWAETDAGGNPTASGFISLTPNGPNADAAWVASGQAYVAATATDPDGNAVTSPPFALSCLAATDAASVTVSGTVS